MSVADIIRRKALQYGVDPDEAIRFAQIESGLKPSATSPSGNHAGLYQFSGDLWKKWGKGDIADPEANADAFMRYYKGFLQPTTAKIVGDKAEPWQRYIVHQQGEGGAQALFATPDQPAVEALAPYYTSSRDPYGLKLAQSAIVGNGGSVTDTGGDFLNLWRAKYSGLPALPPAQHVSTPAVPAMAVTPDPRTAGDADLAGYGSSPPQPDPKPNAKPKEFNYGGLLDGGTRMIAAGIGDERPSWQPGAPVAAHRPDMQFVGLLNPFMTDEEKKRRQMMGGLL